jgi:hypothetical protein
MKGDYPRSDCGPGDFLFNGEKDMTTEDINKVELQRAKDALLRHQLAKAREKRQKNFENSENSRTPRKLSKIRELT